MSLKIAQYGWKPDLPDVRDFQLPVITWFQAVAQWFSNLLKKPASVSVDLRAQCPPVYDQGALGSCTANAIGGMFEFMQQKQGVKPFMPSRLFIYYNERDLEGTVGYDSGAFIRDGMKVINKLGVCKETTWPYKISQFVVKPPQSSYTEGLLNQSVQYMRVNRTVADLQKCLTDGYPFVFGFTVYESFESAEVAATGIVPMPKAKEKVLGGHAVMAVGYDVQRKLVLVRNSWGSSWGIKGYFWMPIEYLTNSNLSDDFWTLRQVEV